MTIHEDTHRAPFAAQTKKADKRHAGRTEADHTQLDLRTFGRIDPALRRWIYGRLGRELGKFAPIIERVQVRLEDENGPKGGLDKCCTVRLLLSSLPPLVVTTRGMSEREAFDLAAGRAERALHHALSRRGFTTKHLAAKHESTPPEAEGAAQGEDNLVESKGADEPWFDRRAGHGHEQLMLLAARPEKVRRDLQVDTALPGSGADDRKVGYGHTARRNTKLNTAGMSFALEDSTNGRPSRKSTRGGMSHVKPDTGLTRRTRSNVQSPQARAERGQPH